jgi:hypothetical protein
MVVLTLLVLAVRLVSFAHPMGEQATPIPEYRVKATFLFQFTQFVDWPSGAFRSSESPFVVGILGDDPFGSFLDETVRDEKAQGHPLIVERYQRLEDAANCQLLFVSRAESGRIRDIAAALRKRSTLIVGDTDGFAEGGGIVQFVTEQNKVHLRINLNAARVANLTISSKLLRLATVVNPGER